MKSDEVKAGERYLYIAQCADGEHCAGLVRIKECQEKCAIAYFEEVYKDHSGNGYLRYLKKQDTQWQFLTNIWRCRIVERFRSEKHISAMDKREAQAVGISLPELIDREGRKEILQQLVDTMEYGKTYCVLIEKNTRNDGFSETVSFDLKFEKLEG